MINERAKAILEFCFIKTQLEQWFQKSEKFDKILKNNFLTDYMKAINNEYDSWSNNPEECVALIMLLDQLSRNFFRNNSKAYGQDAKCISIVRNAISKRFLEKLSNDKIHFLLLPLIHSEDMDDHILGHKLVDQYLNKHTDFDNIKKAWNYHTVAIKKFGRYPHRNRILKRESTIEEIDFLKQPNTSW